MEKVPSKIEIEVVKRMLVARYAPSPSLSKVRRQGREELSDKFVLLLRGFALKRSGSISKLVTTLPRRGAPYELISFNSRFLLR